MKFIDMNGTKASQLVFGCMRISSCTVEELEVLVKTALDNNINFFDHADIYGGGKSEELFGEVLLKHPEYRQKMIIQSKCGIRKAEHSGYFDFSKEHIIYSVNESLRRLHTDYLDILILHRPDTLFDPAEVAEAFDILYNEKKVKYFGVSNMNSLQIELLQKHTRHKIMFNQLQLSPVHSGMMTSGLFVNMKEDQAINRDDSILEYCRINDITIQAWSIMQASWAEGTFLDHPDYPELNDCLALYANKYNVSKSAIVVAWILTHPAQIQAIFGTTQANRIIDMAAGADITLSRPEWYHIYTSAIKSRLP